MKTAGRKWSGFVVLGLTLLALGIFVRDRLGIDVEPDQQSARTPDLADQISLDIAQVLQALDDSRAHDANIVEEARRGDLVEDSAADVRAQRIAGKCAAVIAKIDALHTK